MRGLEQVGDGQFLDPPRLAPEWGQHATRDLDLDGRPDLLWKHSATGDLVAWLMDGIVLREGRLLDPSSLLDLTWKLVGTAIVADRPGKVMV
jgi:hypothetical protein